MIPLTSQTFSSDLMGYRCGEFLRQVQSVVRHVNDLQDGKSTKVTKNLLMATGSAITPEFLKNTRSLPDNGSKLFSRDFVDMTKNLIKKGSKVRDEDERTEIHSQSRKVDLSHIYIWQPVYPIFCYDPFPRSS
ncbi:predicted protein [Histoplasma capsulatum var. duboisii H88]|uniref:Predicted protein n=1 Tax=Ajellomyces capsulatus (strain H88) TaxID=544711 RepID=F0U982_AJEC8|nr:predicted protein [Histoplasma capsulatum var. duboisii H88]